MAKKAVSTTNAGAKKPRGKPFEKGDDARRAGQFVKDDPRRNNAGQRSKAVIQTLAQARALYAEILNEPVGTAINPAMTNLELIIRQQVAAAKKGISSEREDMFDRIWDKTTQPIDARIEHEHSGTLSIEDARALSADELAGQYREALGKAPKTK